MKLLKRWFRDAEDEESLRACFKLAGVVQNLKEINAPSFVAGYNGKPLLMAAHEKVSGPWHMFLRVGHMWPTLKNICHGPETFSWAAMSSGLPL